MDFSAEMLSSRLRRYRIQLGLSIEQLARLANVDKNTIVRIEKGGRHPNLNTLLKICGSINVTVDQLIDMNVHENQDFFLYRSGKSELTARKLRKNSGLRVSGLVAKMPHGHINSVLLEITGKGKLRSHPGEELLFCLDGKIGIKIGATELTLEKRDSVLFFGHIPHQYFNAGLSSNSPIALGLSIWLDEDVDPNSDYA